MNILIKVKSSILIPRKYSTFLRLILMRLHSPVDLTGNVNMIEKLVLGGTGTGDLPILSPTGTPLPHSRGIFLENRLEAEGTWQAYNPLILYIP